MSFEVSQPEPNPEQEPQLSKDDADLDSDSDSDYNSDSSDSDDDSSPTSAAKEEDVTVPYVRPGYSPPDSDNSPEANIARFAEILESKRMKRRENEEDRNYVFHEDLFDFPEDKEHWREEDLQELWADAPLEMTKPGWDPAWVDEDDVEVMREEAKAGRDPPIAPFYLPYRKPYPAIPDNHYDIATPKAVIEELDRIEEFLTWVSYIFPDGSSYEGTVWDDLAHGKGVFIGEQGLVRYEGEWLQNNMEGHGVVEVDIPDIEPLPGSKLEAKWRAEGKIMKRDFMSPEDRKWLEMDIEDSIRLAGGQYEIPFYENDEWIKQFGRKPEKGRYRYAGQWKHGRMHGCGVYEVNERTIYGRFYFGEFLEDASDCDEDISGLHAGIAEVAAAKARMFVNKPDGMVREERGPYNDPQHPYFYEEEDVWMAPGFINQFYEVPDYWKRYVHEVDQEREMWLNSFYKAPLRLPMPAELEYWWDNVRDPEFVILNKEPEPDPEDPSKLIYTEDPVILHTPTGLIINYIEDEEHGVRLFWQPPLKDGEDVDPEKVQFLPLGFDEFYGKETVVESENVWGRMLSSVENACKPLFEKLEKWTEEKKKASETKIQLLEKELEFVEAELTLEEAIDDLDEVLKMQEKVEAAQVEMGLEEEDDDKVKTSASPDEKPSVQVDDGEDEEEVEEEEEEDDGAPSSFGSVPRDEGPTKNDQKGNGRGQSPFSAASLSLASCSLLSLVPSRLQPSFVAWRDKLSRKPAPSSCVQAHTDLSATVTTVNFPRTLGLKRSLKAESAAIKEFQCRRQADRKITPIHSLSRCLLRASNSRATPENLGLDSRVWLHKAPESDSDSILSLHAQGLLSRYTCWY